VEIKWLDESATETGLTATIPIVIPCSDIFNGNEATQRIGRQVRILSINVHAFVRHNAFVTDLIADGVFNIPPGIIRMVIFLDKQPELLDPTIIDSSGNPDSLIETNFLGHLNPNARSRFFVISDKFRHLGRFYNRPDPPNPVDPDVNPAPTIGWDEPQSVWFKEYKKLDIISTWGDFLSTPITNRLFVTFITNIPLIHPTPITSRVPFVVTYDIRIRFTDV